MAFVQTLLDDAIYKSLQDRENDPIIDSGYQNFALYELNLLLDEWRDLIPFAQQFIFTNVDELSNTNFVTVANVNYVLNNVSSPLIEASLTQFMEIQQITNLTGVPIYYYFDQLAQTITVYPTPSNPSYQFIVWGWVQDQPLTLFTVIPTQITPFMYNALVSELAFRLCNEYGVEWSAGKEQTRDRLFRLLQSKVSVDLTPAVDIVFGQPNAVNVPTFPYFYYMSGGGS